MSHVTKMDELKQVINELSEAEAKSLLFQVLLRMNLLRETKYSEKEFVNDIENIYETVFNVSKERLEMKEERNFQRLHILFGASPAGALKMALKEMGIYQVEKVISFRDLFSIGPVWMLHEKSGQESRFDWLKNVMNDEYNDLADYKQRFQQTVDQLLSIPEDVPITIWIAENAHEQTGLRYVLHLLKNKTNDIKVINTTKAYVKQFNLPDFQYTILQTGEISPEELQAIYEQSQLHSSLSQHERKKLEEEWLALADTQETLRIWRNGRIKSVSVDYYDQYMINMAKKFSLNEHGNKNLVIS